MDRKRLLVSWIGFADLRSLAADATGPDRAKLLDGVPPGSADDHGPLRTLLDIERFDDIHVLSNYPAAKNRLIRSTLGCGIHVRKVQLTDPTDYATIFSLVDRELAEIAGEADPRATELCIHLSPGTPAMAAVWVLLGKTRYPATFFQTHGGRAWTTEIPFDITADFLPELLRHPDAHLQHLAAQAPGDVEGFEDIIGDSEAIRIAVGRAKRAAVRDVPVLILGESGTGKEMFAHAIHHASHRRDHPFVAVNCAAIPRELIESELFGHTKGAFTGAARGKKGAFDQAAGGTLFLDEIGDCGSPMQAKLLRIMQPPPGSRPCTRVFTAVGGEKERTRDVRIIAATNRVLVDDVASGSFRQDLYFRLAVISLTLPPLRLRRPDLPTLAAHLLGQINREFDKLEPGYEHKSLSASAIAFVKRFDWPGNVRQLHNALVQAATMCDGSKIERADLDQAVDATLMRGTSDGLETPLGDGFKLEKYLENLHRQFLQRAMEEAGGVKTRAAKLLGMRNYQTLDAQLKRLKVRWK